MIRARSAALLVLLAAVPACSGAARSSGGEIASEAADESRPDGAAADTVVGGRVALVGAEPFPELVLRPTDGGPAFRLTGAMEPELRRVRGVEVRVEGTLHPTGRRPTLDVEALRVVAVSGTPAVDGTLERGDAGYVLATAGGERRSIGHLPPPLQEHVGAWVWLSEPLDAPDLFGIIRPAP